MAKQPSSLTALSEAQQVQATERLALIRPALEEGISQAQIARVHQLSLSTVQRWIKHYREQGLIGLVRASRSDRGSSRGLSSAVIQWIEELAQRVPARSVAAIHRQVCASAQEQGWKPPSYARVYQIVQRQKLACNLQAYQEVATSQEELSLIAQEKTCQKCISAVVPTFSASAFSQTSLLASKLCPPRLHASLIARERLLVLLDAGLERKLTLLVAPAGFGKTTLLAQWVLQRQHAAAWLSLDSEDNDPHRFLAYLMGALQRVHPGLGQGLLTSVSVLSQRSLITAMVALLNELSSLSGKMLLILDNYQMIENQIIHNALTLVLDHLPAHVHLVLASRGEPFCQLARLRAARQLTELGTRALRFTRAEMEKVLLSVMHLELQPEEVEALEQHTEGWIAGLQLAGFALQGQQDLGRFFTTFGGNNRYILAYFLEEVLESQPEKIQCFLLATSFLEVFNGSLCAAVAGQTDAERVLEHVERANLFCFSHDEQKGWYRYHPLFAGALRHHLERTQPDLLPVAHTRASRWFEAHGMFEEAIKHALAAQDVGHAAALLEQIAPTLIRHGALVTVQRWLAALPHEIVRSKPRLCISMAWIMFITSQVHMFPRWVKSAEQALCLCQATQSAEIIAVWQAEIIILRAIDVLASNDFAGAIAACRQALQDLPTENHHLRGLVSLILGLASSQSISMSAGVQAIAEARSDIQAIDHTLLLFSYVLVAQAELCMEQAHPSQAAKLYQQILSPVPEQHAPSAFAAGLAHVGLGYLLWDWNNVPDAKQHLLQAWDLGLQHQAANLLIPSALLLAIVSHVQGEKGATDIWLQRVESVCRKSGHMEFLAIIAAHRVRFCLVEGHLDEALLWLCERHQALEDPSNTRDIFEKLTLARVLIAAGRAHADGSLVQRALTLLKRLRVAAEDMGRVRVLLDVLVQQALALQVAGDSAGALCALGQAVSLAEPGKYIRLFVDEGNPLAKLLRQLQSQQRTLKATEQTISLAYLCNLLNTFTSPHTSSLLISSADGQPPLDPLSRREREVLRLMAVGRKNREIADELVVVTGTVKAHINMIYQKLGVSSRVQAVVRARTLGLL